MGSQVKQEFKTLLHKFNLPADPSDANIEAFSDACHSIVERERARILSHHQPRHLNKTDINAVEDHEWRSQNVWTEEPKE